jgi:hypothetical protein
MGRYGEDTFLHNCPIVIMQRNAGAEGPRSFDVARLDLKRSVSAIRPDNANTDILHNEVTTIDNAFSRPWTVTMSYHREHKPIWTEFVCAEGNNHVTIGGDTFFLSADGLLMPTRKNQPPPRLDLKYFRSR